MAEVDSRTRAHVNERVEDIDVNAPRVFCRSYMDNTCVKMPNQRRCMRTESVRRTRSLILGAKAWMERKLDSVDGRFTGERCDDGVKLERGSDISTRAKEVVWNVLLGSLKWAARADVFSLPCFPHAEFIRAHPHIALGIV